MVIRINYRNELSYSIRTSDYSSVHMRMGALHRRQLNKALEVIRAAFPEKYADKSFDNTGLLIDCSSNEESHANNAVKMLLTVDLTSRVADEAVKQGCNLILAYHPFIFPSWNRLNPQTNVQHASAIKLIQNNISVYSPHTAVDAVDGGVNDWLVESLVPKTVNITTKECIESTANTAPHDPITGYGRYFKLDKAVTLQEVVDVLKKNTGLSHVQIASLPYEISGNLHHEVQTVAVCAGSGSGVFRNLKETPDLYVTGELSHHEVLKYKEMGKAVILCNHSNTERGYVKTSMLQLLKRHDTAGLLQDVQVSETDRDPLNVV